MSGVSRFDLHLVNINKAETMDEFKQANEALALDEDYAAPVEMVVHDNEADGAADAEDGQEEGNEEVVGEEEGDEDESTVSASYVASSRYRYILPAPPSTTTTTPAVSTAPTPMFIPVTSSAGPSTGPSTVPSAAAAIAATTTTRASLPIVCDECRRKHKKCIRPSGTGSCEGCLHARGGAKVCSLTQ